MIILSGSSIPSLAKEVATINHYELAQVELSKFPNGESRVWVKSKFKDQIVAIFQSFSNPVDDHVIEFSLLVDAAKNLGARQIIAVIPWLGYSPQDKEFRKGEPVSVAVIAKMIQAVGITSLITVDIHSSESLKNFDIPVKHLSALPLFIQHWKQKITPNHVAIALDRGSLDVTAEFASNLDIPKVVFSKKRDLQDGSVTLTLQSGDFKNKHGIAIDDFVSTGATRITAASLLKDQGLLSYHDCITHAVLAQDAAVKIDQSQIDSLLVTNTYPVPPVKQISKLQITSIAPIIAQSLAS